MGVMEVSAEDGSQDRAWICHLHHQVKVYDTLRDTFTQWIPYHAYDELLRQVVMFRQNYWPPTDTTQTTTSISPLETHHCRTFFVFLFSRFSAKILLIICPEVSTNMNYLTKQGRVGGSADQHSIWATHCIHWCISSQRVFGVISSGVAVTSLFGHIIIGLSQTVKTQDSDFTWERRVANVPEITLCISETEREAQKNSTH